MKNIIKNESSYRNRLILKKILKNFFLQNKLEFPTKLKMHTSFSLPIIGVCCECFFIIRLNSITTFSVFHKHKTKQQKPSKWKLKKKIHFKLLKS